MPGCPRKSPSSMSHRRESFFFILSVPLLLSKSPCHARKSVGRRRSSPSIIAGADGPAPANPSPCRGHRQRAQARRECLPATACQRSARVPCDGVRSQFSPRGRDTYSAWLQCQPSRSRPGHQTHQTYCLPTSSEPPPPPSVARCAQQVQITCPSPLSPPLVRRQPRLGGAFLDDGALNRSFRDGPS